MVAILKRPWTGWFLMVASGLAIGLVLFQMSRQSPAARISTAPPIESAPPLWTPKLQDEVTIVASGPVSSSPASPSPVPAPSTQAPVAMPAASSPTEAQPTVIAAVPTSPAPTSPAPTSPAPASPEPARRVNPLPTDEVTAVVAQWAATWSARDVDGYLRFYSEDFPGREAFARQKRGVMGRAAFIEVKVTNLRIKTLPGGQVEALFTQQYRSSTYQSIDLKRQVWQRQADQTFQIIAEVS